MLEVEYIDRNFKGLLKGELLRLATNNNIEASLPINQYIDQVIIAHCLTRNKYWLGIKDGIQGLDTRLTAGEYITKYFKFYKHRDRLFEAIQEQGFINHRYEISCTETLFFQIAFNWSTTKQGKDFWCKEFEELVKCRDLPSLKN